MKIYKTYDNRDCRDRILVTIQPDPEDARLVWRRFSLCYVPDWPEDVEAARTWLEEQTLDKPDGEVPSLAALNLRNWREADDEIDNTLASLRRFYELIYWPTAQEAVDWAEENLRTVPEIREGMKIILAALVELRDSDELIGRHFEPEEIP